MPTLGDSLGLSPSEEYELAISSLGACLWCLCRSLIDKELLLMKNFTVRMKCVCLFVCSPHLTTGVQTT